MEKSAVCIIVRLHGHCFRVNLRELLQHHLVYKEADSPRQIGAFRIAGSPDDGGVEVNFAF